MVKKKLKNARKLAKHFIKDPKGTLLFLSHCHQWGMRHDDPWKLRFEEIYPCIGDHLSSAGNAQGHYFLQDLWAAQHVARLMPTLHVDVGSLTIGFVAHVASFTKVEYIDIRPLRCEVPNLLWKKGSVTKLPHASNSVSSLSCLHVIEHIGLGRYGDELEINGWELGLRELQRVLAPGGQLLIGTPCGRPRVQFNAHRVFDPSYIVSALPGLDLVEFSLIESDSAIRWQKDAALDGARTLDYGCGLFRFTKATIDL